MVRKKKSTTKSENISLITQKTEKVDLNSEVPSRPETSFKTKTGSGSNFANICHKKCIGSNNWKTFLDSTVNQKPTNKKPPSGIRNSSNKKPTQENQHSSRPSVKNLTRPRPNKTVVQPLDVNNAINESCNPEKTFTDGESDSLIINSEVKMGNKLKIKKKSGNVKPELTKQIAMDCEMVGVEIGIDNNMLARVSLVNAFGDCIYDKFVKPTEPVLDYRTHVSGVRAEDLENAEDFKTVQEEVSALLKDRVLVGHSLRHDLKVLFLSHPRQATRDTSRYKRFREGRTPSLKKLAKKYLGVTIQEGEHSSVQDALAAMQLYRMFKKEWEATLKTNTKFKSKIKKNNISV